VILGEAVKAFVIPTGERDLDEATLVRLCRQRLEDFMVPRQIVVTTSLPRTDSGKIHKTMLA
jgi:acyl-coenzyme A synthetase/AMP-(fatty) acid ligase